jgi:hypothetical protein
MLSSFGARQLFQHTMCNMWPHRQYSLWLYLVKQLQELRLSQVNVYSKIALICHLIIQKSW